jgi:hypothetical protein
MGWEGRPDPAGAKLSGDQRTQRCNPEGGGRPVKKHSSVSKQSELPRKVERRETREVMSELVRQLQKQVDSKQEPGQVAEVPAAERPNLDRMTVGVDLGDQWSNYCILGLGGETLAEGQFRMQWDEVEEFFQGLSMSRVVFEVGRIRHGYRK